MSKNYKKKNTIPTKEIEETGNLTKKELYDLNKKKKEEVKAKQENKKKTSKKKNKKTYQTNLAGRIFAVVMLILMLGSVVASIASYMR